MPDRGPRLGGAEEGCPYRTASKALPHTLREHEKMLVVLCQPRKGNESWSEGAAA